jgi:microcystin-dependent protein
MVSLRFREQLPGWVGEEFDSLVAQLRAFFSVSFNEDGTLQGLDLGLTSVPIGAITPYAGSTAPTGWLLCDGNAVSRVTYKSLFEVIGTTYGAGDGSTTYNLPDLRQRFPLGKAASGTGAALGATGGVIDHTHSISSVADHTHAVGSHTHDISSDGSHDHGGVTATENQAGVGAQSGVGVTAAPGKFGVTGGHDHNLTSGGSHNHGGATAASTAATSGAGGAHDHGAATGAQNPPFLSLNYLILAGA